MYASLKNSNNLPLYNPMYNIIHRLKEIISKANMIQFCLIVLIGVNLIRAIVHLLFKILQMNDIQFKEELINPEQPVLTVTILTSALILVPIVETALFQTFIYQFKRWLHFNNTTIVLISAVCFCMIHNFSLLYMICTFFGGSIFMYVYILRSEDNKKTYWSVALAHSILNAFALFMVLIFNTL